MKVITSLYLGLIAASLCASGGTLIYQNSFDDPSSINDFTEHGGGSWWITPDENLTGIYNIGCGSINCSQSAFVLKPQFQPTTPDWMIEWTFHMAAYPGSNVQQAQGSMIMFVSPNEKYAAGMGAGGHGWTGPIQTVVYGNLGVWGPPWVQPDVYALPFVWDPQLPNKITYERSGSDLVVYLNDTYLYTFDVSIVPSNVQLGFHIYGITVVDDFRVYEIHPDQDADGILDIHDNCPNTSNADQSDADGDGLGDACDPDIDGDGVANESDLCVVSNTNGTVVIDGCDSGVGNVLDVDNQGCSLNDLLDECATSSSNHGQYVRCVASMLNALKKHGVISGREKGAIQSCAAQSDLP